MLSYATGSGHWETVTMHLLLIKIKTTVLIKKPNNIEKLILRINTIFYSKE